ncbi:type IV toxin-antitoxin system AbiEi family antitoxin [Actinoplanes sp. NPDC026670]|uniref:type IV toxin-antitoxin system AbiEi family antitoxin n=1 Tax=Actinoplanes sp. NPDC026670 TaxID=3154700 RepID=UPI0033ED6132
MSRTPKISPELATGPFRASQAIASGLITPGMLTGPGWQRLLPDVYAHRDVALDHRAWCTAAMLALPACTAIGGQSAAFLWGAADAPGPVHIVVPRTRRLRRDEQLAVHYTTLAETDLTSIGELRITTPERTVFDLGRRTDRADALPVLDSMLHRHLINTWRLERMIHERREWPRAAALGRLLPLADARSESPMETRLRLLLIDAGTAPPAVQFEVRDTNGVLLARTDLAWPAQRLAVEYDGDHHREKQQFRHDLERLNHLRLAGWTVLRFSANDVFHRPAETAAMVRAVLHELTDRQPSPTAVIST